jgi:hypothetical protein
MDLVWDIVIIGIMCSVVLISKVITLSGFYGLIIYMLSSHLPINLYALMIHYKGERGREKERIGEIDR